MDWLLLSKRVNVESVFVHACHPTKSKSNINSSDDPPHQKLQTRT